MYLPHLKLAVNPRELVSVAAILKAELEGPGASGPGADTIPPSSRGEDRCAPISVNGSVSRTNGVASDNPRKADHVDKCRPHPTTTSRKSCLSMPSSLKRYTEHTQSYGLERASRFSAAVVAKMGVLTIKTTSLYWDLEQCNSIGDQGFGANVLVDWVID